MRRSLFALILLTALAPSCHKPETVTRAASDPPPVAVSVLTITAQTFQSSIAITGTLVSNSRVDVKAEVIGRITRFDKEEGARVTAGEPIAWVNDENYQLAVRQAETAVKVAEAAVERAALVQSHSHSELDRAENPLKSGGITDKDLKAAQLADCDAAAQVTLAKAQLDQAHATLDTARKHVRDTVIVAPVAGEIQKKMVNAGAYVEAPTAVFTIVDNSRLELESPVPSAGLGGIRPNQPVSFTVNSYPGDKFEGRVIEINPAVDEQTRSAKVRVRVANAAGRLKAGMFTEGEILTGANRSAIVIPNAALYRDDRSAKSSYVFILENGKAARRDVRIGQERDSQAEIADGLRPGDRLIAEQSIEIAHGVRVEARR